eukprot:TRINITY_DN6807_c0_g1_i1.p1 TRINITY_DN6807_c0_g1~~TRINITY_DN6807_c0_g1_i1.p1  ORF type:complete len:951 (+),score=236.68 TRINITY_DN6807_c0_g1_i1:97-2853(+)
MGPCGAMLRCFARVSARPGDTPRESQLKPVVANTYLWVAIWLCAAVMLGSDWERLFMYAVLGSSGGLILFGFLPTLFGPWALRHVATAVCFLSVSAIIICDWDFAASMTQRAWTWVVLVMDMLLVVESSVTAQGVCACMLLLWLVVDSVEAATRFGLYDAAVLGEWQVPEICNCPRPPCRVPPLEAVVDWGMVFVIFTADYWLTRGFADTMRHQMALVDCSVEISERLASLLAEYSVDSARRVVDNEGYRLPARLCDAFSRLLDNLLMYRPYLPDSLLEPDDPAGWRTPEGSSQETPDTRDDASTAASFQPEALCAPGALEPIPEVCVCFTDIQASTALWEAYPQGMHSGLRVHNSVLRATAAALGGYEVKTIGDAFMLVFSSARAACSFGLQAQRQLLRQQWAPDLVQHELCRRIEAADGTLLWHGLRVRVGLHWGEVRIDSNPITGRYDYFGPTVNTASRVEGMLRYGGLLGITGAVLDALGPDGLRALGDPLVVHMGNKELKGVREPVAISLMFPHELAQRQAVLNLGPTPPGESSPGTAGLGEVKEARKGRRSEPGSPGPRTSLSPQTQALTRQSIKSEASRLSGGSDRSAGSARAGGNRLGLNLRTTMITTAVCRASLAESVPVGQRLPHLVLAVEQAADMTDGLLVSVLSASCTVTWGSTRHCWDHAASCARFMGAVQRTAATHSAAPFHVGVSTGGALTGNVAAVRRRFATVISGRVELAAALAEEAEIWNDAFLAVGAVADHWRLLGAAFRALALDPAGEETLIAWEIDPTHRSDGGASSKWDLMLARRDVGDDTPKARSDPSGDVHLTFLDAAASDPEQAIKQLQALAQRHPEDDHAKRLERRALRRAVRTRRVPALWEAATLAGAGSFRLQPLPLGARDHGQQEEAPILHAGVRDLIFDDVGITAVES